MNKTQSGYKEAWRKINVNYILTHMYCKETFVSKQMTIPVDMPVWMGELSEGNPLDKEL